MNNKLSSLEGSQPEGPQAASESALLTSVRTYTFTVSDEHRALLRSTVLYRIVELGRIRDYRTYAGELQALEELAHRLAAR